MIEQNGKIVEIQPDKFWKEYSTIIQKHEHLVKAHRGEPPTEIRPLSSSTFFKWTNNYLKQFPRDKTFTLVNSIIFGSKKPSEWVKQLQDGHLRTYISRKFLSSSSSCSVVNYDNLSIYDSYVIACSITERGVRLSELLNGISVIKYLHGEENLTEAIGTIDVDIIKAFHPFGRKIVQDFIDNKEITERDGFLHYKKKNTWTTSLKHTFNLKRIESLKPYLHQYQSPIEASVGTTVSLSDDKIQELRKDLKHIIDKYSVSDIESSNSNSHPIRLGLSITKLLCDEYICGTKREENNETV